MCMCIWCMILGSLSLIPPFIFASLLRLVLSLSAYVRCLCVSIVCAPSIVVTAAAAGGASAPQSRASCKSTVRRAPFICILRCLLEGCVCMCRLWVFSGMFWGYKICFTCHNAMRPEQTQHAQDREYGTSEKESRSVSVCVCFPLSLSTYIISYFLCVAHFGYHKSGANG